MDDIQKTEEWSHGAIFLILTMWEKHFSVGLHHVSWYIRKQSEPQFHSHFGQIKWVKEESTGVNIDKHEDFQSGGVWRINQALKPLRVELHKWISPILAQISHWDPNYAYNSSRMSWECRD